MSLKPLNKEKVIDLHTEGIQDIITSVPPAIIRRGIAIFLFVLVLIVALSAIIHYPEVISTKVKVKFNDTQLWIRASSAGKLQKVFFGDNQTVREGDLLASMETNINPLQVLNFLEELRKTRSAILKGENVPGNLEFGNDIQPGDLQNAVDAFKIKYQSATGQTRLALIDSLIKFVDLWKDKFLLLSPANGKVFFTKMVNDGTLLSTGEAICYILPDNRKFYGEMIVKANNRAKVAENQKVVVYFSNYGYDRRFSIEGTIKHISQVLGKEESFWATVSFPENSPQLKSVPVILTDGMILDAEIVTKDITVLERMTRNLTNF